MPLVVRRPQIDELQALGELCMRSKAIWGYDQQFLEACRDELSFSAMDLQVTTIGVLEHRDTLVGVAQVTVAAREANLLKLFVAPEALRCGIGELLFTWAAAIARDMDADRLLIDADPNAAPFYRRMGARDVGLVPSDSIPGRLLPRLVLDLHARR
jgi:GNAT superfamily N-acetyltransferase